MSPHNGLGSTVLGRIDDLEGAAALSLDPGEASRYSRAALLGAAAVRDALREAGVDAADTSGRTILVTASLQFGASELQEMYETFVQGDAADVGMAYWRRGTPAALIGGISALLGLSWPTLNIAGSCNVGLRALEVGLAVLSAGLADRLVLLGVDSCVDDLFLAGALHQGSSGYQAAVASLDIEDVRPHDSDPRGNASGEGAIALVIEADTLPDRGRPFRIDLRTVRSSGRSTVATGPTAPLAQATSELLRDAEIGLADVAFVNDYADGNAFVEEHFVAFLDELRSLEEHRGRLTLVNQEGIFGHVAGPGGLLRLLVTLEMLAEGAAAPCPHVRAPHGGLGSVNLAGGPLNDAAGPALIVSSGAGGDATVALVWAGGERQ
ncbi:beta-ketoacyl synthase N-terminal-like domain-containing protein [Austwickia chelonae]|uniref:beta-ketoacyl synthase N-terminal-like domain-containing protein n=1 Tax=Austwickia chelonae TaxID=100225 RepID=UPI0013C2EF7F|nr:beta-ketoacyl synthase N-terminal-like domain-containing protein [Austwickia chelonae]